MFQNQLNPDLLLSDAINQKAQTKAQLLPGRMGVYSASQAGDRLGTRIGGMMGLERPEVAQQQNLEAILQKYPKMDTPEKMLAAASDLRNAGFLEYAQKMVDNATNLRNSQTTQTQTTYMQDLRDIARYQLACDFNDPECAKAAQELWLDQKRAGVEEKGDVAYTEADMKAFSEDLTASKDMYTKALYYGKTIDQSLGFLEEGLYTGPGADLINALSKVGIAFGITPPNDVAQAEQFKVNSMKAIMAWVQKTKGAISEAEMQLFADASEGLARSEAGNKLILLTAKSLAEYQKNLHRERVRWLQATENPSRIKWEAHLMEWNETNANIVPSADEIAAALGSDNVETEVIENENVVITEVPLGG
jgi:hypothetical protein